MTKYSKNWTVENQRESNRRSYYKHRKNRKEKTKQYQNLIKLEVFRHYSNGEPRCECCGEDIIEFLALDHKNGGGNKRRSFIGNSYRYYFWLRRNKFPLGYRILCHNCNQATSWGRKCPHK